MWWIHACSLGSGSNMVIGKVLCLKINSANLQLINLHFLLILKQVSRLGGIRVNQILRQNPNYIFIRICNTANY